MRGRVEAVSLAGLVALGGALSACAVIAGLDEITESDCAPDCDGAVDEGSSPADVAAGETTIPFDAGAPPPRDDAEKGAPPDGPPEVMDAPSADTASADVSFVDSMSVDSRTPEAAADAPEDARPDRDGAADSRPPGDGGLECGSPDDPDNCGSCHTRCSTCAGARACSGGVCAGGTVYFYEPFDDNAQGWSVDPTWSIAAECASPPPPQKGNPDPTVDHTSPGGSSGVVGAYVCGNTPQQIAPARYATSPAVDISAAPTVKLTFYRWLNSDIGMYAASTVDVFDGSAWVNIYTNPSTPSSAFVMDAAWTKYEYDVTQHKSSRFQVRFGYALVSAAAYSMSSWNVDDVTLSTTSCP